MTSDGYCDLCYGGTVPDLEKRNCIPNLVTYVSAQCTGPREIYSSDRTYCIKCEPYTRA